MVTKQPNAAVNAIMAQGRLLGLIIDRRAVLHASTKAENLQGPIDEIRERLVERLSERLGSRKARKAIEFLEQKSLLAFRTSPT